MSLYSEASEFLNIENKSGSLRSIIYNAYEKNKKLKSDPRQVVLLVSETIKYKSLLSDVIKASGILKTEKRLTKPIALLMVHDLLLSKSGRINCGKNPSKDAVLRHKTRLKAELVKYKVKHKTASNETFAKDNDESPIRWIRINPINTDATEITQLLSNIVPVGSIGEITLGSYYKDIHVKNLYGVHPSQHITSSNAYKKGQIIIQDRASCFPAEILSPKPGDVLIDACSAPGNKTTHLAAHVMGKEHSITAFERDPKRGEVLKKMVRIAGASKCVSVKVQDFTQSDPQEFADVTGFVVDPSCSGSGIFGRGFEEEKNEQADKYRLHKLAEFQYRIVSHAMTFPSAKTVVYSTCSIHAEENEQVVKKLLESHPQWKLRTRDKVLPKWHRRGLPEEFSSMDNAQELAEGCVRALPKVDGGIGFFAACFDKLDESPTQGEETTLVHGASSKAESSDESEYEEWNGF
ncbi:25S rRNA (cytosine(2278)-C(5))-methyltransferase [Trichomonascus vanleenenianus]|uniref:rRNA (cytosine-C5-)-methyltransferase RCM1 n=1 Tax=Trichomonascus vanleenenianus TaxID=2268995 RepID=UPI003ECB35EC